MKKFKKAKVVLIKLEKCSLRRKDEASHMLACRHVWSKFIRAIAIINWHGNADEYEEVMSGCICIWGHRKVVLSLSLTRGKEDQSCKLAAFRNGKPSGKLI